MPRTIKAIYEHGVFVPQTPVNLPEHVIVKISLPGSTKTGASQRFQGLIAAPPLVAEKLIVPSREERHAR